MKSLASDDVPLYVCDVIFLGGVSPLCLTVFLW